MKTPRKTKATEKFIETSAKSKKTLEKRKEAFSAGLEALRKEYKLDLLPTMDFIEFKQLPVDIQLALEVLNKYPMRYVYGLIEVKEGDSKNEN